MLFPSPEMQRYLRASFEHFCTHANSPFNFLRAAVRRNRVAKTFEDHIIEVANFFVEKDPQLEGEKLAVKLSYILASSIILNATRTRLPGRCKFQLRRICACYPE